MENYRMNCAGCRPYHNTCGMNNAYMNRRNSSMPSSNSQRANLAEGKCHDNASQTTSMYQHLSSFPLAMAYVPEQSFSETFKLSYALQAGTIFPDLCKPFCGRRCVCR
ncbi:MAG TPA: spore coat associated protein CotJA [Candidatus Blautia faecavium]|uniref:Spore coat associated protein CotJA n=1 Tax=Candidatus Blautia faecavium TaxID=2838487 RepID=A0A9D2RVV6_9FIRM|nr:spore coat associated protein CotJA [Candidatus Blautia faecavium]